MTLVSGIPTFYRLITSATVEPEELKLARRPLCGVGSLPLATFRSEPLKGGELQVRSTYFRLMTLQTTVGSCWTIRKSGQPMEALASMTARPKFRCWQITAVAFGPALGITSMFRITSESM